MKQEIHYDIRFSFPSEHDARGTVLAFIDMYLCTIEEADRLMVRTLGLESHCHRTLKEMGKNCFLYSHSVQLNWPIQMLLGGWPDRKSLRLWMQKVRRDFHICSGKSAGTGESAAELVSRWDTWASEAELTDSLIYMPIEEKSLSLLMEDLHIALAGFGRDDVVIIE